MLAEAKDQIVETVLVHMPGFLGRDIQAAAQLCRLRRAQRNVNEILCKQALLFHTNLSPEYSYVLIQTFTGSEQPRIEGQPNPLARELRMQIHNPLLKTLVDPLSI